MTSKTKTTTKFITMDIPTREEKLDSKALSGLRGLASLHVILYHCLVFSQLRMNISGSFEMPLFFLLSGYSLTLGYGRATYNGRTKFGCYGTKPQVEGERCLFRTSDFFRNRFARIMPMYYFTNFVLALPLCVVVNKRVSGYSEQVIPFTYIILLATIDSVFPVGMILPVLLWPFVAPGWTISTMWCFYLFFPILLPKLQQYSNDKVSRWIVYCFWIQLIVGIIFSTPNFIVENVLREGLLSTFTSFVVKWFSYWLATGWGISRLPIFIMGILSAILRLRNYNNYEGIINRNLFVRYIYSFIPWVGGIQGKNVEIERTLTEDNTDTVRKKYSQLVDIVSLIHIIVCLLVSPLLSTYTNPPWRYILNWLLQFLCVHSLLIVIDGLTGDGGHSILSMVCRSRPIQQLGRCSMSLYLIHEPIRQWGSELSDKIWGTEIESLWLIPIVVIVSIVIAWLLTVLFEEPIRNRLRAPMMNVTHAPTTSRSADSAE